MRQRAAQLALTVVAAGFLTGCFGGKNVDEGCNEIAEYQADRDAPVLQVPDGLAAPNQGSPYAVPPDSGAELKGAACLARPPPYFRPDPAAAPAKPDAGD